MPQNHLVIVLDDAGPTSVESFAKELKAVHFPATPQIGALEAQGVRFARAYVNPACSPTRSLLLTGRYAFRTGMGNNANLFADGPPDASEPFMAKALDTTHTCGLAGKWHLFSADNGGISSAMRPPTGVGFFDEWDAGILGNIQFTPPIWNTYWYHPEYSASGTGTATFTLVGDTGNPPSAADAFDPPGNDSTNRVVANYNTTRTIDAALSFIAGASGPWYCMVGLQAPHNPIHKPPTAAERTAAGGLGPLMSANYEAVLAAFEAGDTAALEALGWADGNANAAAHYAMMEAADTEIGRLISDSGIDLDPVTGDTTVWIITDNGPQQDVIEPPFEATQGKNTMTELGTRASMVVAGLGVTATGTRYDLTHATDVYRTILAQESIDPAVAFPGVTFDGVDLSPVLADITAPAPRDSVYLEQFSPLGAPAGRNDPNVTEWRQSFHDGFWKLSVDMPQGPGADTSTFTWNLIRVAGGDFNEEFDFLGGTSADIPNLSDQELRRECGGACAAFKALKRLLVIRDNTLPAAI